MLKRQPQKNQNFAIGLLALLLAFNVMLVNPQEESFECPGSVQQTNGLPDTIIGNINELTINLYNTFDLSFLESNDNVPKKIKIENAQFLTQQQLDILNRLSDVTYEFDANIIKMGLRPKINLKDIKGQIKIIGTNSLKTDEMALYQYINFFGDLELTGFTEAKKVELQQKYEELKELIIKIYKSFNIDESKSTIERITEIGTNISEMLHYDEDVKRYLFENLTSEEEKKIKELIDKYNNQSISSVLSQYDTSHESTSSICANYSSLATIFFDISGIESYDLTSDDRSSLLAHAINMYKFDGNFYLIDLTNMDAENFFDNLSIIKSQPNYQPEDLCPVYADISNQIKNDSNIISKIKPILTDSYTEDMILIKENNPVILLVPLSGGIGIIIITREILKKLKEKKQEIKK